MRTSIVVALCAITLCAGCAANPGNTQQSNGCPPGVVSSAIAPVSCGPLGWPNGGVVTNANGNGPHVEIWGPPNPSTTTTRP